MTHRSKPQIDGRLITKGSILMINLIRPSLKWDGIRVRVINASTFEMKGIMLGDGPAPYLTGSTVFFALSDLTWPKSGELEEYLRSCVSV